MVMPIIGLIEVSLFLLEFGKYILSCGHLVFLS